MWAFSEIDVEQGTPEWFQARAGRLTGSEASTILAKGRKAGEESVGRRDYRMRLALERFTGNSLEDEFDVSWVNRGKEIEPLARNALEAKRGYLIDRVGFIACQSAMAGCSLDGHVDGYQGIIELKCPKSATHMRYLRERVMPKDYMPQVLHNLMVSDAQWCDFASYDPRFPPHLQLFVVRLTRADLGAEMAAYESEARRFLAEVQVEFQEVQSLGEPT